MSLFSKEIVIYKLNNFSQYVESLLRIILLFDKCDCGCKFMSYIRARFEFLDLG